MTGFQTTVNQYAAPAVAGDFASANPRASVVAPEAGFVAGVGGLTVGRMAWIGADGRSVVNYGTAPNAPDGFVHREQQALITSYLGEASNVIPAGFPVTLQRTGDYFATVTGSTAATKGAAVYANYSDGKITIGSATASASVTGSVGATFTASAGSPDTTQLVVTSVTGLISIGDVVSGTGITAGTTIVSQVSGTTGGAGTYKLSAVNTTSSATVTSFGTVLNVTAVSSGNLTVGTPVTGTGMPTNAVITAIITGAGGVGTYSLSVAGTAYAASTTVTGVGGVSAGWTVSTAAAVGELTTITK